MARKKIVQEKVKEIKTIVGNAGRCTCHETKGGDYFYFLAIAVDTDHGTDWFHARVFGEARALIEGRTYDFQKKEFVPLDDKLCKGDLVRAHGAYESSTWDSKNFGKMPGHYLNVLNKADLVKLERPRRPKTHRVKGF